MTVEKSVELLLSWYSLQRVYRGVYMNSALTLRTSLPTRRESADVLCGKRCPEHKKVLIFLNAIGGATYDLLRSVQAPDSPMMQTLSQIIGRLQKPKPSIIVKRFNHNQHVEESIAMYIGNYVVLLPDAA